jgi:hypothetical protein
LSGSKADGCDVDHSPPSSTEFKNEWIYTSSPPICLYGMERDNVTFLHVRNFQDEIVKWKIKFVKHCDRLMFNIEIENIAVY